MRKASILSYISTQSGGESSQATGNWCLCYTSLENGMFTTGFPRFFIVSWMPLQTVNHEALLNYLKIAS